MIQLMRNSYHRRQRRTDAINAVCVLVASALILAIPFVIHW